MTQSVDWDTAGLNKGSGDDPLPFLPGPMVVAWVSGPSDKTKN